MRFTITINTSPQYSKRHVKTTPSSPNCIVTPMSETYQSKRRNAGNACWKSCPLNCGNISPYAMSRRWQLLPHRHRRAYWKDPSRSHPARAIEKLRAKDPQTSVADLLNPPSQIEVAPIQSTRSIAPDDGGSDSECFPDMPRVGGSFGRSGGHGWSFDP